MKEIVKAINIMLGAKVKIRSMARDVTVRGSNIFNARGRDIKVTSVQAPL